MRVLAKLCLALITVLLLASCGGDVSKQTQTDSFNVKLILPAASMSNHQIAVELTDKAGGAPASADSVVIAPVMREMGMASPELTASQTAPGRYEANGMLFSMLGVWEIDVRITANGKEETAIFQLDVVKQ